MAHLPITVVTLTYNNLDEARKTIASVALQSVAPDSYLIVDSSSEPVASGIKDLANRAGANYQWVPARGVYPAMNDALRMIPDKHFVWFINSSDWLSDPRSLEFVADAIAPETSWIIGGVERWGDRRTPQHPLPATSADFVWLLVSGKTGFPHPAAIMSKRGIDDIGLFDESYLIAGDYDLALRFAEALGEPTLIPHILSVHVPTGLTSRHRMRHALEKLSARKKTVPSFRWSTEVITQAQKGLGVLGLKPSWTKRFTVFPQAQGFGSQLDTWPQNN